MKKKLFVCLLLALCLMLSVTAAAWGEARIDHVSDYAGVLSDSERASLNERAEELTNEYGFGVFIVVVNDYTQYVNGTIENFAENIFHRYELGWGSEEEGVVLAMSMNDRSYDIYAHGDFGNYAFTDYGKTQLADSFLDNFRRNDWAGGFRDFLSNCGTMLQRAKDGNPVDTWIPDPAEQGPRMTLGKLLVSLGVGCATGGVTVGSMKRSMKTAVRQSGAANYVSRGGVTLSRKQDDFVNRSVTRQVIPRQTSGSRPGGGHFGGTSISGSHGGSHHSGRF